MAQGATEWIFRHSLAVRLTHWVNVLCVALLLMSGLQIFNAHPALYWGERSSFDDPFVALSATRTAAGELRGATIVLGRSLDTTGVLGVSTGEDGLPRARGFPSWLTIPSYQDLATGRRWHFFFAWLFVANGAIYLASALVGGHLRRDLVPTGEQLRHIGRSLREHIRLRFPEGEEAKFYNVLQKLSYLAVALVLLPLIVATGLTMSPGIDAAVPQLVAAFGGRQSARTIHFLAAAGLVIFVAVHVAMVLLSGFWNNMRAMVTGWYAIAPGEPQ